MGAPALVGITADPFAVVRAWRRMVSAGFSLSVEGGGLVVTPASNLSESQRTYIRAHKAALVALLEDSETLRRALVEAGTAGLGWREGTPPDWSDGRLLAAGEVLYSTGRMVSRWGRRYAAECAPAVAEGHLVDYVPRIEPQTAVAA